MSAAGAVGRLALDFEREPALPRDAHALAGLRAAGGQPRLPALAVDEHLAARMQAGARPSPSSPTSVTPAPRAGRRRACQMRVTTNVAIRPSEPAIASTSQKLVVP